MKYKHQTRIGNWSEEWELEQTKYILFFLEKISIQQTIKSINYTNLK